MINTWMWGVPNFQTNPTHVFVREFFIIPLKRLVDGRLSTLSHDYGNFIPKQGSVMGFSTLYQIIFIVYIRMFKHY